MSQDTATQLPSPGRFFASLADAYALLTGNTTADIFAQIVPHIQRIAPITHSSVIHDNAAGPGTATAVLLSLDTYYHMGPRPARLPHKILITDTNSAMINAAESIFDTAIADGKCKGCEIAYGIVDATDLALHPSSASLEADSLSHSILNFSIFAVSDPVATVRKMHHTLRDDGLAILTCWKRLGTASVIHRAQTLLGPDLPPMRIPHAEFLREGELQRVVLESGFDKRRVITLQETVIVKGGEELWGLKNFMLGDLTKAARKHWSDEERKRWPHALKRAMKEEMDKYDGMLFEAWVVLAQK